MNENNNDFYINKLGAKILLKSTNSYITFIYESSQLEFFLIYILLAEHSEKDQFRNHLIEHFDSEEKNIVHEKIINFLGTDEIDHIFDIDTYELYFGQMAFTRITDNALCYFKEVLTEVVKRKPEVLKSSEKETYEYILSFENIEDLIEDLSEKKIKQLFYGSINDIKKFFEDKLGIKLFDDVESENSFNQLTKQRNLIVHNRGIITTELAKEFNEYDGYIGQKLHFTYEQLSTINKIISNIIAEIDIKLMKKFKLEIIEFK